MQKWLYRIDSRCIKMSQNSKVTITDTYWFVYQDKLNDSRGQLAEWLEHLPLEREDCGSFHDCANPISYGYKHCHLTWIMSDISQSHLTWIMSEQPEKNQDLVKEKRGKITIA